MHKYAIIGLLALIVTLAACTTENPNNPNFIPPQCRMYLGASGQPEYIWPLSAKDCVLASDGSGRIVLRG